MISSFEKSSIVRLASDWGRYFSFSYTPLIIFSFERFFNSMMSFSESDLQKEGSESRAGLKVFSKLASRCSS